MKKLTSILLIAVLILPFMSYSQINNPAATPKPETLSPGKARLTLLKSLAIPGWGEHSLGYNRRGYIFQGAELMCWATYAAFYFLGNAKTKDMKAYAAEHASVDPGGKDKNYFANIGQYQDIYSYNNAMYRNRSLSSVYADHDEYFWQWETKNYRKKFDDLRYSAAVYRRNATLAATALLINRIVSVIDIMALTGGKIEETGPDIQAYFTPGVRQQTLSLDINL